ncbi:MAG: pyridoxamine 5'-phosphate oxidase family protein [Candidatus Methylomirabilales bacterium]
MSRLLGRSLPEAVRQKIGFRPETMGKAVLLITIDEVGFPHTAMLSFREVAAKDTERLRFCLSGSSRTSENLRQRRKAALLLIDEGSAYYIKGVAKELKASIKGFPDLALFELTIEEVLEDEKPDFPITSGIQFKPPEDPGYFELGKSMAQALKSIHQ